MLKLLGQAGQALRIGVTRDSVCLVRTTRWGRGAPQLLGEQACAGVGDAAIGTALAALLAGAGDGVAGLPASVVLADDLLRLWLVTPPPGVARLADLEAAAALRFQTLYGESAAGWKVTADWRSTRPFCAAAVPLPLLMMLEQGAAARQLALVAVLPHFIDAWNRWSGALQPGAWFGQLSGQVLTLGVSPQRGRLHAVRTLALPAGPDLLALMLQREALLLDVPAPSLLQVAGPLPASWQRPAVAGALMLRRLSHAAHPAAGLSTAAALVMAGAPA